jgi:hypothetical protein
MLQPSRYPPVGSTWQIKIGPDIPLIKVVVISSGHGIVAVKQLGGKYTIAIDILAWERRYQATQINQ